MLLGFLSCQENKSILIFKIAFVLQDLHANIYKMLMKVIKEKLLQMIKTHVYIFENSMVRIQLLYRLNIVSIKFSARCFGYIDKLILKFIWKATNTRINKKQYVKEY